jgi:transcriptional regulator with PAS, ATPase and Fis domain
MVHHGLFRKDLLFRINTLSLYIPPLSERREDIEILSAHFLAYFCKKYNKAINGFSPKAASYLGAHHYEGNVRELRGLIERAVIISEGNMIRLSDLQGGLRDEAGEPGTADRVAKAVRYPALEALEKNHIRRILDEYGHSMTRTAEALGISRSTLWRKLRHFDM